MRSAVGGCFQMWGKCRLSLPWYRPIMPPFLPTCFLPCAVGGRCFFLVGAVGLSVGAVGVSVGAASLGGVPAWCGLFLGAVCFWLCGVPSIGAGLLGGVVRIFVRIYGKRGESKSGGQTSLKRPPRWRSAYLRKCCYVWLRKKNRFGVILHIWQNVPK